MKAGHAVALAAALLACGWDAPQDAGHHGRVQFRTDVVQALREARIQGKPVWILGSASW